MAKKKKKSTEQKWRERYSRASSRLRKQIENLEKRYPESVALEQGRKKEWAGLKELGKDYSLKELKRLTAYAEKTLKSGLYSLQRHRRAYANAQLTLKRDYGITLTKEELGAYFRFRSDILDAGINQAPYRQTANLFREAKGKGMSRKELKENIRAWAKEYEEATKKGKAEKWKPKLTGSSKSFAS